MTESATSLVGKLLIAMPTLADPNFWHTVVLVGVHSDDEGAFGLVINRPLEVDLGDILSELGETVPQCQFPQVLAGGPVEPNHGFVMYEHSGGDSDESALQVNGSVTVSGSTETLTNLAAERAQQRQLGIVGALESRQSFEHLESGLPTAGTALYTQRQGVERSVEIVERSRSRLEPLELVDPLGKRSRIAGSAFQGHEGCARFFRSLFRRQPGLVQELEDGLHAPTDLVPRQVGRHF